MRIRLMALLMALCLLGGCAARERLPLQQAVDQALTSLAGLTLYPADELELLADVTPDEYTECVYYASEDGLTAREAIAVRAKDAQHAKEVAAKLADYLAMRQHETRDYLPDAYQLWSKAKVETHGLTVALIVGEQSAAEAARLMAGE